MLKTAYIYTSVDFIYYHYNINVNMMLYKDHVMLELCSVRTLEGPWASGLMVVESGVNLFATYGYEPRRNTTFSTA